MSKITVAGHAVVVTSALKLEDVELIENYKPKALTMYEDKEPVFRIGIADIPTGNINNFGISFSPYANKDGYAQITVLMNDLDDCLNTVEANIGGAVRYLNRMEEELKPIIENINAERAAVIDQIEVIA